MKFYAYHYKRGMVLCLIIAVITSILFYQKNKISLPSMKATKEVQDLESLQKVLSENKAALIFFYRIGCPWCRGYAPMHDLLTQKYSTRIAFMTINNQAYPEIASNLGLTIRTVPSLCFFRNQKLVKQIEGDKKERTLSHLTRQLDQLLSDSDKPSKNS